MKLKTTGILAIVSILGFGANAHAADVFDIYIGGMVGAGGVTVFDGSDNHTDSTAVYGAVVGMDIPVFRFELEYDYLNNKDINANVGMVNAYVKMPSVLVHPYLGIGVGSIFSGDAGDVNIDTTAAYQAMFKQFLSIV